MVSLEVLGYLGIHLKNIRRRTNGGKKAMWKRRKGQKKKLKIGKKTHTKTPQNKTEINPIISLIIISTDKLNVLIKWQTVLEWILKTQLYSVYKWYIQNIRIYQ